MENWRRHIFAALFSLNVVLVFKLVQDQTSKQPFGSTISRWVIGHLKILETSGVGIFFMSAVLLSALLFVAVEVFSTVKWSKRVFDGLAGVVTAAALPLCWLYLTLLIGQDPLRINPSWFLLLVETFGCLTVAVLLGNSAWPLPVWTNEFVLALHFFFWGWLLFGTFFFFHPSRLIFPLAGFFSYVAWSRYIHHISNRPRVGIGERFVV